MWEAVIEFSVATGIIGFICGHMLGKSAPRA